MNSNLTAPKGLPSKRDFLQVLKASRLLTAEQLAAIEDWSLDEPRQIVLRMVKEDLLTRWQAQQILAGQHRLNLGKYKLLDKLGEGGMGAVFKAEHLALKRLVAVKVVNRDLLDQAGVVDRFYREVHTVAALDHPNIIRAFDADKIADLLLLVMEYVDGNDLKSWLNKYGVLPVAWACECIRQSALGLQHAHEQGLIHRDIKPGNILVAASDTGGMPQAKVLDLGLAKFICEKQSTVLTQTGICMGTIDYLAPEQAKDSKSVDIRADVYGLGATLFRLVTGEVPYRTGNTLESLVAKTVEDAPLASTYRKAIPPELDAEIAKMLRRIPDERYATPGEVAEALAPFALATMDEPCDESSSLSLPAVGTDFGSIEAAEDHSLSMFLNSYEPTVPRQPSAAPEFEKTARSAPRTGPEYNETVITAQPQGPEFDPTRIVARSDDGRLPQSNRAPWTYLMLGGGAAILLVGGLWYLTKGPAETENSQVPSNGSNFVDPNVTWNPTPPDSKQPSKQRPTQQPPSIPALSPDGLDLLKMADIERHVRRGIWKRESQSLLMPDTTHPWLFLPLTLPEYFRLVLKVERESFGIKSRTGSDFHVVLPGPQGKFSVSIDAGGAKDLKLANPRGGPIPHAYDEPALPKDQTTEIQIELAPAGLSVTCGDNRIVESADPNKLGVYRPLQNWVPPENGLLIGGYSSSLRIHSIVLYPQLTSEEADAR